MKGMLYTLAKLLAYYDEGSVTHKWVLQSEDGFLMLYDMLANVLPNIDNEMGIYSSGKGLTKGQTYRNLLTAMKNSTKEGGFMPWIVDTASVSPYASATLMTDLQAWLESDLISGPNTPFYSTMAQMLGDMGEMISVLSTEEGLQLIYEQYGFQPN